MPIRKSPQTQFCQNYSIVRMKSFVSKLVELGHMLFATRTGKLDGSALGEPHSLSSGDTPLVCQVTAEDDVHSSLLWPSLRIQQRLRRLVHVWRLALPVSSSKRKKRHKQHKAQLQLEIRKLEIETDTAVRHDWVGVPKRADHASRRDTLRYASPHLTSSLLTRAFDISKQLAFVPTFCRNEVDLYFGAFKRIRQNLQTLHEQKLNTVLADAYKLTDKAM